MTYLSKFDSLGRRITSYPLDNTITKKQYTKLLDEGYIEISEEDWNYYIGNNGQGLNGTGYVRGADGKPVDAPAYTPSKEARLAALDNQYDSDKASLSQYFVEAALAGDDELQAELKNELVTLNDEYDRKRAKIEEE